MYMYLYKLLGCGGDLKLGTNNDRYTHILTHTHIHIYIERERPSYQYMNKIMVVCDGGCWYGHEKSLGVSVDGKLFICFVDKTILVENKKVPVTS